MPLPMAVSDVEYRYDGSFAGFLCCVFESYQRREIPAAVASPAEAQTSLFPSVELRTDPAHAQRVLRGLARLGAVVKVREMVGFLNTDPGKDMALLRFAHLCFDRGPAAAQMLGDPDCAAAFALERAVNNEACYCREFLRFEQRGEMLGAVLHPQHMVLPLLRAHFSSRLPDENFLIFDATHGAALVRSGGTVVYRRMEHYLPVKSEEELDWQRLWKTFFHALTIEERRNEKCQMNHCRKRFWSDMVEMREAPPDTFHKENTLAQGQAAALPLQPSVV